MVELLGTCEDSEEGYFDHSSMSDDTTISSKEDEDTYVSVDNAAPPNEVVTHLSHCLPFSQVF